MGIIEPTVTRHLITDEIGLFERFTLIFEFHFSHHQTRIITIELIHFKRMLSVRTRHQIASLVDNARLTYLHQVLCLVECYFLFKLVT